MTVTVTDGTTPVSETIAITIGNTNRAPVLAPIGAKSGAEGSLLTFTVAATDADGDTLTYSASGLPAGANFDAGTRTFSWTPGYDQAGPYSVTVTVTDGTTPVSETIAITIGNTNRAPVLAPIGAKSGAEGSLLTFTVAATDADGDTLTYSASGLPGGANFDAGTRTFSWTPGYDQAGPYSVTVTVTDGTTPVSETIAITIGSTNRAPVLAPIGAKSGAEGSLLTFTVAATDADGDTLTYSASGLPGGANFDAGTRTFSWTPGYDQAGPYSVTVTVTDGTTPVSETIAITIGNTNRAPVLAPIGAKSGAEGSLLTFTVAATDADGDALTYSASGLPGGANFDAGDADVQLDAGLRPGGSVLGDRHGDGRDDAGQRDDRDHDWEYEPGPGAGTDRRQERGRGQSADLHGGGDRRRRRRADLQCERAAGRRELQRRRRGRSAGRRATTRRVRTR